MKQLEQVRRDVVRIKQDAFELSVGYQARDLMAESAGAAMHHDDDLFPTLNSHGCGSLTIEQPIVGDHLDFQIMIARPERAELVDAPCHGLITDIRRIGLVETPLLLDTVQIPLPPVSSSDAPAGAMAHDIGKLRPLQPHEALRADAGGNPAE